MSIMRREQFPDLVLEDQLPVLAEVITDTMEEFTPEHEMLYNIRTMDRGIIQTTQTSGIKTLGQVAEGEEYPMDAPVQGFDKTYRASKYGVILPITQELLDDNKMDEAIDRSQAAGRSMREAQKVDAATLWNNAFSALGPDGKALCAVDHPLPYPGSGTSSNRLAVDADLSLSSLEDMITLMRKTLDQSGKKVLVRPKYLVVPPELEFLAHELLESVSKPQAVNNGSITEVNAVNSTKARYGLMPVVIDYLTDDDAYFLMSDKSGHKCYWYWRKQPETSSSMDFKSDTALFKITARWANGFSDWRGVAGTPGA